MKSGVHMSQKYVLITGASGSIGKATAIELAKQSYHLYLHYHSNRSGIDEILEEIAHLQVEAIPIQADLQTNEGVEHLCNQIFSLHSIVLNSGKAHFGLVSDIDQDTMNSMVSIHLTSPFWIVQKLLPKLMQQKGAAIVAVTSIWGDTGASCEVLYSMLKGGQNAFVKALSKELAPMKIRVNAVSPGAVHTPMNAHLTEEELSAIAEEIPLGRLAQPEEIAKSIYYLLSPNSSYITGHILRANGGWYI